MGELGLYEHLLPDLPSQRLELAVKAGLSAHNTAVSIVAMNLSRECRRVETEVEFVNTFFSGRLKKVVIITRFR